MSVKRLAISAAGGAGSLAGPVAAWAQERAWDWGGWHPMWGFWGAWGMAMMLLMLTFWIIVLAGFGFGFRWLIRQGRAARPDAALDILRERYARGEIGKEEFDAKTHDLRST